MLRIDGSFVFSMSLILAMSLGIAMLTHCLMGCSPAASKRASTAADLAAYGAALEQCYQTTTDYETYEACAQLADRRFGVKP